MNPVGLSILALVLVAATAFGIWRSRNDGRMRAQPSTPLPFPVSGAPETTPEVSTFSEQELGTPFGAQATLVQFSTVFCQPCRATRRILAEVASMVDGVRHVEIDAEDNLDLVRRLGIRRTPTVFVLDPAGRVVNRATGQPRKADVVAALGAVL
jgi:thiol-disulfide isomerase/thioredoxin